MSSAASKSAATASIAARIRTEVDRALQRGIKGLEYMSSGGPALGVTPRDLLQQRGTLALYHYRPMTDEIYRVPLLLVMAVTNRGYILDLAPGQSLVEYLLKAGYDVFVIDWNAPRPDEKHLRLEDYVQDFIPDSIARVQRASGVDDVTLVGYCMGGLLSTLHTALNPKGPVKNLAVFTTPIDFSAMKLFSSWSDRRHFDVDKLVDTLGNAPPEMIYRSFDMLRPADSIAGKVQLLDNLWNDEFVKGYRMFDRWASDILPLPGEFFRQTTKELMWANKLATNQLVLGGKKVDLGKIKVPVFHAVAEHDHIVPYDAARPLVAMVGSKDKEEVVLKGGHVSVVAGAHAVKRLWPRLDAWLGKRST
ncbi:PHA/PHB synthase family protein [Rhizobacter fulvus]|jgi:polyhydroxyalkanoate synthase